MNPVRLNHGDTSEPIAPSSRPRFTAPNLLPVPAHRPVPTAMTCRIPREDDRKIGGNQTERRFSSRNFLILGVETPVGLSVSSMLRIQCNDLSPNASARGVAWPLANACGLKSTSRCGNLTADPTGQGRSRPPYSKEPKFSCRVTGARLLGEPDQVVVYSLGSLQNEVVRVPPRNLTT